MAIHRPRPGRRRGLFAVLAVCLALTLSSSAYELEHDGYDTEIFDQLAARGEIHIDTGFALDLERRQVFQSSSTSSDSSSTSTEQSSSSSTATSSASSTAAASSTTDSPTTTKSSATHSPSVTVVTTSLPVPFDSSLGTNFTSPSCPQFFTNFLANSTFKSCTPISLLLQNSMSFFEAERSAELLSATLDTACQAPLAICTPVMTSLASQLMEDSNCGADFRNQQPLVLQAYNGFVGYEPVYRATCLKDEQTNDYCFTEAVTNSSNPSDIYPYYTAIGLTLPAVAKPSCTSCLQQTMAIFAQYAVRKEQPLAQTYLGCANGVDSHCGPAFAATNVKVGSITSSMGSQAASMKGGSSRPTFSSATMLVVLAVSMIGMFGI